MSVTVENLEHNMAKLTFDVEYDVFDKAVDKVYNRQKSKISISGFRKGKAPRHMIEKMYGAEIFYDEALGDLIPEVYSKAREESGLDIVSTPLIDFGDITKGEPISFTAEVAVRPEVKLPKYKGVEVGKIDTSVTDEDIEKEMLTEQEKNAREVPVDRPAEDGDIVVIDFEGYIDGELFNGGQGKNHPLRLGSGSFIPGFEEQLIGAKSGDEVEVNVTFPEDYQSSDLSGKDALFKCLVHEVKAKELPPIDDELADDAGFDSLDEYKADIRSKLESKKQKEAKDQQIDEAMEIISEGMEVDIPDAMINTYVDRNYADFSNRIMYSGMNMEQYLQFSGLSEEAMKEQMRPSTIAQIKTTLALDKIAKEQGFSVSDEELDEELDRAASLYGMTKEKLKEVMPQSEIDTMKDELAAKKAMEYVYENRKEVVKKDKKAKKDEEEE